MLPEYDFESRDVVQGRSYRRVQELRRRRKIARTIADLEGSEEITPPHISEAVTYRSLDRLGL